MGGEYDYPSRESPKMMDRLADGITLAVLDIFSKGGYIDGSWHAVM